MRPIILGCGNIGSGVARKLAELRSDLEFFVADINLDVAEALADEIGGGAKAVQVDVTQTKNIIEVLSLGDVVLNTIGPFYRTALLLSMLRSIQRCTTSISTMITTWQQSLSAINPMTSGQRLPARWFYLVAELLQDSPTFWLSSEVTD